MMKCPYGHEKCDCLTCEHFDEQPASVAPDCPAITGCHRTDFFVSCHTLHTGWRGRCATKPCAFFTAKVVAQ